MKNPYHYFDKYFLRFPVYSIDGIKEIIHEDNMFNFFCLNKYFQMAILISSPDLYLQLKAIEIKNHVEINTKDKVRFNSTLMKYLSRMSTRSTPFGLFSGISVGELGKESKIVIDSSKITLNYQYDNTFLYELVTALYRLEPDKFSDMNIYSNNMLFGHDKRYKFIEFFDNFPKGERTFKEVITSNNTYLTRILKLTKTGCTLGILLDDLISQGYSKSDALAYLDTLIINKLLLTEIQPTLREDYFTKIVSLSNKLIDNILLRDIVNKYTQILKDINSDGLDIQKFNEIIDIKKNSVDGLINFSPIKSTVVMKDGINTLDKTTFLKIKSLLPFFNKITTAINNPELEQFTQSFYKKYEFREVNIVTLMDNDIGLGYPINHHQISSNPLIENLNIKQKQRKSDIIRWNTVTSILHERILSAYTHNKTVIELYDSDFEDLKENWDDIPNTIYANIKILQTSDGKKIVINGFGGPSAVNLLTRFTYQDKTTKYLVSDIVKKENENADRKGYINAEIIHAPNIHLTNVFEQKHIFDHFIPILSAPLSTVANPIPIEDIMVRLTNDMKIELRSKKLNKIIKPFLPNAHNSLKSNIPVYRFLTDLQLYGKRNYLGFYLDDLQKMFSHIPRIEYKNCIVLEARWFIKFNEPTLKGINQEDTNALVNSINNFRNKFKLPELVLLCEGDNELLIDFENQLSVKIFLNKLLKSNTILLKEFLFKEESLVKNVTNQNHCHELIISFYKNA
ncbi:hypothetical protein AY601_4425 [Pedobacter cryoconitis]|uniref:Lantibiotic dehydratase N-terminal domain-containing protein n=1 Tax=Pedobacter cryoconitis TaxID=188932 RepID=A0A127VIV8_9SPHI|nr:lantibiotic dehydratase family protein [Pedobacter cryoconitis]AMQ01266.1 hypothetical protein AY601_4425 [Pedobacter cryoconitis]